MKPHIQFHTPHIPLFFKTLLELQSITMVTKLTMECQYSSDSWRLKQESGPSRSHNFACADSQEWQQYNTVSRNKLLRSIPNGFRGTLSTWIYTYVFTFTAFNSNTELIRRRFWTLYLHFQAKWRYGTYSSCTVQRISTFTAQRVSTRWYPKYSGLVPPSIQQLW
jgi:hypothetical protein